MNGPIPLSDLTEAFFDAEGLAAFGKALDAEAQALSCGLKGAATAIAEEAPATASATLELLIQGKAMAAQLRYAHGGLRWTDTLLREEGGRRFKLVRMASVA